MVGGLGLCGARSRSGLTGWGGALVDRRGGGRGRDTLRRETSGYSPDSLRIFWVSSLAFRGPNFSRMGPGPDWPSRGLPREIKFTYHAGWREVPGLFVASGKLRTGSSWSQQLPGPAIQSHATGQMNRIGMGGGEEGRDWTGWTRGPAAPPPLGPVRAPGGLLHLQRVDVPDDVQ